MIVRGLNVVNVHLAPVWFWVLLKTFVANPSNDKQQRDHGRPKDKEIYRHRVWRICLVSDRQQGPAQKGQKQAEKKHVQHGFLERLSGLVHVWSPF